MTDIPQEPVQVDPASERLIEEFHLLRDASLKALFAYQAIGMGPRGWSAKDREAFAELTRVLGRPIPRAPGAPGEELDGEARARLACRLLAACRSEGTFLMSPLAWAAVVAEADLALPGYRQYVSVNREPSASLAESKPSPAMTVARLAIERDALYGFPKDDDLCRLAEEALEPVADAAPRP